MSKVFIVAEAGIAHEGDLRRALDLIADAASVGADAIKFQTFDAAKLAARRQNPDLYAKIKPYEMPLTWLPQLRLAAERAGVEFMTTCFDEETLRIVAPFVKRFKISHVESRDKAFVEAHFEYGKPVITSHTKDDVPVVPDTFRLYCTSKYPTAPEEAKLVNLLKQGSYDGFSDHTRDDEMGGWAVAAGARIVEVHFGALNPDNPDYSVSHDTYTLNKYILCIRRAEKAVYGVDEGETRKLTPPQFFGRISHQRPSGVSSPSDARQEGAF